MRAIVGRWGTALVRFVGRSPKTAAGIGLIVLAFGGLAAGGPSRGLVLAIVVVATTLLVRWRPGRSWWRPEGMPSFHGFKTEGDLLLMGDGGPPVPVPWRQVTRVWFTPPHRDDPRGTVQVELDDGFERHRFSVPMELARFSYAGPYTSRPDEGFRAECLAHGVEVRDGRSGLADTDPALFSSWASLYDVVHRQPHRFGGIYQGPDSGVLQVVPGQTNLTPGLHIGARVAEEAGIPARDLMVDVTVVECKFSRAQLTTIRDEILRVRYQRKDLDVIAADIVERDNAVRVTVRQITQPVDSYFDRFGQAVQLVPLAHPA